MGFSGYGVWGEGCVLAFGFWFDGLVLVRCVAVFVFYCEMLIIFPWTYLLQPSNNG